MPKKVGCLSILSKEMYMYQHGWSAPRFLGPTAGNQVLFLALWGPYARCFLGGPSLPNYDSDWVTKNSPLLRDGQELKWPQPFYIPVMRWS